jgi:hypothetical protein
MMLEKLIKLCTIYFKVRAITFPSHLIRKIDFFLFKAEAGKDQETT